MNLYVYDDAHCKHDATEIFSNPNLLINGDFQVWQRGVSIAVNKKGTLTADRWTAIYDSASYTVKKDSVGRLQLVPPSAGKCGIYQKIELNSSIISSLKGNTYTLSFYVLSSSEFNLTSSVNILYNGGSTTNLGRIEKLIEGGKTTKVEYTFTIPSDANFDDFNSLQVVLLNDYGIQSSVYFSKVKLEMGDFATPFIPKSYAEELILCERYYQTYSYMMIRNLTSTPGVLYGGFPMRTRMRIKPTYYSVLQTSQGADISSDLADYYLNDNAIDYIQMKTKKLDCLTIKSLSLDAEIY